MPFEKLASLFLVFAFSVMCLSAAAAQESDAVQALRPQICTGEYNGRWGLVSRVAVQGGVAMCPPHYAIYGTHPIVGGPKGPSNVQVHAVCCPLPAEDILLDEHRIVSDQCPDGFVATGAAETQACDTCVAKLRCTRINSKRYSLGPAVRGSLFSVAPVDYSWKEDRVLRFDEVSPAIRYGITRITQYSWDHGGCIGEPQGSLLVGKENKRCKGIFFRRLMFAGSEKSAPVPMFPLCNKLSDRYSSNPECLNSE